MPREDAMDTTVSVATSSAAPLSKLTDAQVFSKDAELYTEQDIAEVVARLTKTLARFRKARQDTQAVLEAAAKIKATNAKARKAKAKKTSTQVFEEVAE
jgi:hypothetical protein